MAGLFVNTTTLSDKEIASAKSCVTKIAVLPSFLIILYKSSERASLVT